MSNAHPSPFEQSELWIRLAVCINVHIKKGMLSVLHNEINDTSITPVPSDPVQLFSFMVRNKNTLDQAKRKRILKDDQYSDLFPHNKNVDTSNLDITLIRFLIQTFNNITNDEGHWREPKVTDLSIAAFIHRAAGMRNKIFHFKNMETMDNKKFEDFWNNIEYILSGLQYNEDLKLIKTQSLDPTLVRKINDDIIKEFLAYLQDYKTECAKEPLRDDYIPRQFRNAQNNTELPEAELEKILDDNSGLIIHGEAGLGKSVIANQIKRKWINGEIFQEKKIIFFNSKKINQKIKVRSNAAPLWFSDITTLLKARGKTYEDLAIFNCVKAAIPNLLIFVDGIDEFPIKELANEQYVSELEKRIQNNEEISAIDTIVGIYFAFLFPTAKVCLLGRNGEFEELKKIKDQQNSVIFDKMNRVDLQLLPFNQANVKEFTCTKICKKKSTNGQKHSSCNKSCHEIYDKIKDLELCKIPTDLNALVEMYKNHPNENIGRITKTKLFIATLLNRLNEHTNQKSVIVNKTFEENREDNPKLVEGIRILGEISFNSLREENVTVKVKDEKINDIVYFKYNDLMIEREILETLDFFYIRDLKYHNYLLEPYHLTNLEFLAATYLFSNPKKWDLLLELSEDRLIVILPFLAGLFADDYFTRDFSKYVLNIYSCIIEQYFDWLYYIKDIRKILPNGGSGFNCWYGLSKKQKPETYSLTPSFYLLDAIDREIEIPETFIPTETIVCYCDISSSFEWHSMTHFKHDIITKHNNSNKFNNINSFLDKFNSFKIIVKGDIWINNNNELDLINTFYDHNNITFRINNLYIFTELTTNIKHNIKSNTLDIDTYDSHTHDIILSALSPHTRTHTAAPPAHATTHTTSNIKHLYIDEHARAFNALQTENLFEVGLSDVDVIALSHTFFTTNQIETLHTTESKHKHKHKQIKFRLLGLDFNDMLALPSLGTRHVALWGTDNVNDVNLNKLKAKVNKSHNRLNISNLNNYKIIDSHLPFIRKDIPITNSAFYLHLYEVYFKYVSPNVFASTFSFIPTLECTDDDRFIPSSHWNELSRTNETQMNELRIWDPTFENLDHFLRIKTNTLQLICESKDELKKVLDHISNSSDETNKTMKVFVVKYDENNWDYYDEIELFSEKTIEEFRNNQAANISKLDEISATVPFYEGEQHLMNWCCDIRVIKDITVSESDEESVISDINEKNEDSPRKQTSWQRFIGLFKRK